MNDRVFSGHQILLTDDIPINIEIARRYLQKYGFEVDCACDGKVALDLFEASDPGTYSIIIMDIRMPIMDGYEAARRIRTSNHPDALTIPIIALSADAMPHDVEKALACGMNAHIAKPFECEHLLCTIRRFIKSTSP
ncbi:MAG: response regulator [Parabacteroides sp.]|nr:response regulator [Parabacteroides sp.]